jgi:threonine synthase
MATSSIDTGSALTHLQCTACGREHDAERLRNLCPACGKVLFARYDLRRAARTLTREAVVARPRGMWRWRELLPVREARNIVSLGEGDTPLMPVARLGAVAGLTRLLLKDEGTNPTGSFKARGISAAVSRARELGVRDVALPTAGNAGGALAAYAARAGLEAHVYMPVDAPELNRKESAVYGAEVVLVRGLIDDCGAWVRRRAAEEGWFDLSTPRGRRRWGWSWWSSSGGRCRTSSFTRPEGARGWSASGRRWRSSSSSDGSTRGARG